MRIRILTTGGTIDKVYFDANSDYEVGESNVKEILRESHVTLDWTVESVLQKDSLDITDEDRKLIREVVQERPEKRIIITHGTDTMIETAQVLENVAGKTIVLTGSLSPARFKASDAVFNVGTAIGAVQSLAAGVYIVMNGRVFSPERVRKNRRLNRFEEIPLPESPPLDEPRAPGGRFGENLA